MSNWQLMWNIGQSPLRAVVWTTIMQATGLTFEMLQGCEQARRKTRLKYLVQTSTPFHLWRPGSPQAHWPAACSWTGYFYLWSGSLVPHDNTLLRMDQIPP